MNLIRQSRLIYRRGASEKIYEIELCETTAAPPTRYVVNYRYGRRGGTFKEGSKTISPVSRAEADRIFDHLEEAQLLKGYEREGAAPAAPASAPSAGPASSPGPTTPTRPAAPPAAPSAAPSVAPAAAPRRPQGRPDQISRVLDRLDAGDTLPSSGGARGGLSGLRAAFNRRQRAPRRGGPMPWPLNRAIWRAGELEIVEAVPRLLTLIGTGDAQRDYCVAWALGRIGDRQALGHLNRLYRDVSATEAVKRIAAEAMRGLLTEEELATFRAEVARRLPSPLSTLALSEGSCDALADALAGHLGLDEGASLSDGRAWQALELLYRIDNATTRPVVKAILRRVPLKAPTWQSVRHIFKAAELRLDAEIFGLIAWRIARSRAAYTVGRYNHAIARVPDGPSIRINPAMLSRPDSPVGYSDKTRAYLRRRVWRMLKRLGEANSPAFVPMAVGVLLPFTDEDARSSGQGWRGTGRVVFDPFASYWAFNHLLYARSALRGFDRATMRWYAPAPESQSRGRVRSRRGQLADRAAPRDIPRPEAFPELWDAQPGGLLHLLDESRCAQIHTFAATALRANNRACNQLPDEAVAMLLTAPYEITARLGLDLARVRGTMGPVSAALLLACARSVLEDARALAFEWFNQHLEHYRRDDQLLAALITSEHADTRAFIRGVIRGLTLDESTAKTLAARLIAALMALGRGRQGEAERARDNEIAEDVAALMFRSFAGVLASLGGQILADLIRHPLPAVQALGGDILINHSPLAADPPEDLLLALLDNKSQEIRALGLRLLGQLDDEALAARSRLLAALVTHSEADLRAGAIGHLKRLTAIEGLGQALAEMLIRAVVGQQIRGDGAQYAVEALEAALIDHLPALPLDSVWRLLHSKTKPGQAIGGLLLRQISAEQLSVDEIARLARHEILTVRETAWAFYRASVARVKAEMNAAVRIFDCEWADSREFAFEYFSDEARFGREDFTPQILVGVCDSVRPDVQLFGRRLITQYFQAEDGVAYMLKLAEHPSVDMQLFVSQYLDDYAHGDAERVEALTPYFSGVLARVNRGGVAKARIMRFLAAQVGEGAELAALVAELLARQSATIAITDRARCIEIMTEISQRWPDIELPLLPLEPEARIPTAAGA